MEQIEKTEQTGKIYLERKNELRTRRAQIANWIKQFIVFAIICWGFFSGDNYKMLSESTLNPAFFVKIMLLFARPYIGLPVFVLSVVLTCFWTKSRWVIAVHGALCFVFGYFYYMAYWATAFFRAGTFGLFWPHVSCGFWVATMVIILFAWDGMRTVKVKEVPGMRSIFPEQR
ncbi:MAG: hypothetical protein J5645_01180 [Lachnospiraceae bacterium]|nr:hypothetical protein [Lachnospiraceae bacterium]